MTIKNQKLEDIHILAHRKIVPVQNWNTWLTRFNNPDISFEEATGLLHTGFNMRTNGADPSLYYDRLSFYFSVANGWDSFPDFPGDNEGKFHIGYSDKWNAKSVNMSQLYSMLAHKSFDMLCTQFFKKELGTIEEKKKYTNNQLMDWWLHESNIEWLLLTLQKFFSVEMDAERKRVTIANIRKHRDSVSHNETIILNFLLELADFLWKWEPEEPASYLLEDEKKKKNQENSQFRERISSAQLWMIEVLSYVGKLEFFETKIDLLDKKVIKKFTEIAMRNRLESHNHPVEKTNDPWGRLVKSLDEACYAGSKAAWIVKKWELWSREQNRLENILDMTNKKKEIEGKLEKLKG